jgi:hypothetical protein
MTVRPADDAYEREADAFARQGANASVGRNNVSQLSMANVVQLWRTPTEEVKDDVTVKFSCTDHGMGIDDAAQSIADKWGEKKWVESGKGGDKWKIELGASENASLVFWWSKRRRRITIIHAMTEAMCGKKPQSSTSGPVSSSMFGTRTPRRTRKKATASTTLSYVAPSGQS